MSKRFVNSVEGILEPSAKNKGAKLELKLVSSLLNIKEAVVFHSLLLSACESTSELDIVLVGHKAIYVFECKNYSGIIYGDSSKRFWKQYLFGKAFSFYNPIFQNRKHIDTLKTLLGDLGIPLLSIVVFDDKTNIYKLNLLGLSPTEAVCNFSEVYTLLERYSKTFTLCLSDEDFDGVVTKLATSKATTVDNIGQHIEDVKEKFDSDIFPLCGAHLVRRKGKTYFLGCSNYPKCKYTRPINA